MKKISIKVFACALLAFVAAACVRDTGDYDYKTVDDVFPVKIASFDAYPGTQAVKVDEQIVFDVAKYVTGTEGHDYSYVWVAKVVGSDRRYNLTAENKENPNLDTKLRLPAGAYEFYLEVWDRPNRVFRRSESIRVDVGGGFESGWYVLKTKDSRIDIDIITENKAVPEVKDPESGADKMQLHTDILPPEINIEGEAFKIGFLPDYTADLPNDNGVGTHIVNYSAVANKGHFGAFMVATRNSIATFAALDMQPIKTEWNSFFYTGGVTPQIDNITFYDTGNMAPMSRQDACVRLISDGKFYSADFSNQSNPGRFVSAKVAPLGTPTHIAPWVIHNHAQAEMVFDQLTHSFMYSRNNTYDYWYWPETGPIMGKGSDMPNLRNMEWDLVWMSENERIGQGSLPAALMKNINNGSHALFISIPNSMGPAMASSKLGMWMVMGASSYMDYVKMYYPFQRILPVDAGSKLIDAKVRFVPSYQSNIYFAVDNKIYMHRLEATVDTDRELLLYTLPEGETIVNVKNPIDGGAFPAIVLSNDAAGNWHLRKYDINTGRTPLSMDAIAAKGNKPAWHETGVGTAVDMAYRGGKLTLYRE